jgi:NTP pyrophosphatase (non-canonical NTP hydrolase)
MSRPHEEYALVDRLAQHMRVKLAANSDRPHWEHSGGPYLFKRLREEVEELLQAINNGEDAWAEAADVANFAAMIADNQE